MHEAKRRGFPGGGGGHQRQLWRGGGLPQAARAGLACIVVQEAFDSRGVAQPQFEEKTRACEAYGAEVLRLSMGPELFYVFLQVPKEAGYFNASLYPGYCKKKRRNRFNASQFRVLQKN